MIVVPMSDLHGYLPKPEQVPPCDVVCICGDIVPLAYQNNDVASIAWFCLNFVPWTDKLECKKVVFVAGNHDFMFEHIMFNSRGKQKTPSENMDDLLPGGHRGQHKIVYLRDNSVEIEGKKFYGTPWVSGLPGWAFNKTEEELEEKWKQMPKRADVLLTHAPTNEWDMGTVLQQRQFNTGANYGSVALSNALKEREIKHVFCGHVHSGLHMPVQYKDNCWIANVSVMDEDYKVQTYYFRTFEI